MSVNPIMIITKVTEDFHPPDKGPLKDSRLNATQFSLTPDSLPWT